MISHTEASETDHETPIFATGNGSVANYPKQESWDSQIIDFPRADFRIWPPKANFATERCIVLTEANVLPETDLEYLVVYP